MYRVGVEPTVLKRKVNGVPRNRGGGGGGGGEGGGCWPK